MGQIGIVFTTLRFTTITSNCDTGGSAGSRLNVRNKKQETGEPSEGFWDPTAIKSQRRNEAEPG
jgi:hypothetical protein